MLICDICGKKIFTACPQNWPYRYKQKIFCSEDCRIVHAARDLHKFEFITLEEREMIRADMNGNHQKAERKNEDMGNTFLTEEQKGKAVEIALEGGDPIAYLKECGCGNPWGNWGYIKTKLQKSDPEKHARITEAEEKRKGKPEKKTVKDPKELKVAQMDDADLNVKLVIPNTVPELQYKVIGIETQLGKFQYDEASDQLRWMPKGSMTVVMMKAEDWQRMAADLPKIMKAIGAEVDEE